MPYIYKDRHRMLYPKNLNGDGLGGHRGLDGRRRSDGDYEETGAEVNHDLCRYLSERREFQFPATFQGLEAKPRIVMALKLAALKAGFCLVTRTSRPHKTQGTKRMRQLEIRLYCEQVQKHRFETKSAPTCDTNGLNNDSPKQQSPQARKKVSTRRHLDDSNLCPFRLSIFMISEASSTDGGRWFLSTPKLDCRQEINNSQSNAHILDGNNKAFNCGRAYIPSGQAWVFSYIFKHVLPEFWGEPITSRLSLMSTDGCAQEYQAFIRNTGKGNTFPNAVHSLCSFHLAILGFNANVSCPAALSAGKQTKKALKIALDFVRSWAYYT
ncbi:hypothetical protein IV203_037144 [Nitzschia inconspicua]|uniref:Uncharacterized protein n=1 Tax=Nitzschia inconspicua TaxID=303405 RepID=A0A9K3PXX8_9STRA|nr:hypothetical protein IV203_037144 [Nitzschia inconspicua]